MNIQAIIFGGIGTLVETSELQRKAFNTAFAEARIPWNWDVATYRDLLSIPGGRNRISNFAETSELKTVLSHQDIAALHSRKTDIFQELMSTSDLHPRTGVLRLINKASNSDVRLAIASTTAVSNIEHLADASQLDLAKFDIVLHRGSVERPKPDRQIYERCLHILGVEAIHAVAIEDSDSGIEAANSAGITSIAIPGENTSCQNFERASLVADNLDNIEQLSPAFAQSFAPRLAALDLASLRELVADIR